MKFYRCSTFSIGFRSNSNYIKTLISKYFKVNPDNYLNICYISDTICLCKKIILQVPVREVFQFHLFSLLIIPCKNQVPCRLLFNPCGRLLLFVSIPNLEYSISCPWETEINENATKTNIKEHLVILLILSFLKTRHILSEFITWNLSHSQIQWSDFQVFIILYSVPLPLPVRT